MNGLYHLGELETERVEGLVARASELRRGAEPRRFPGRCLGLLFQSPSLRTQASMQRAAARLGLELVQLQGGPGGVWGLESRDGVRMDGECAEHVREAARVLGRYVDVLGVRAFPAGLDWEHERTDPLLRGFVQHAGVPVVNLESARWHPCQALADWATLDQLGVARRAKFVLTWAWHPRALPQAVPASTVCMAAQRGMDVVLLAPPGYELDAETVAEARRLASENGGRITFSHDRGVLAGAEVVYAKSWGSLAGWGQPATEQTLRAGREDWCVDERWMAAAGPGARLLHCLPVRRNVVVADEVLDGPRSAVIDQAENRLHAQTALLEQLFASTETKANPR